MHVRIFNVVAMSLFESSKVCISNFVSSKFLDLDVSGAVFTHLNTKL